MKKEKVKIVTVFGSGQTDVESDGYEKALEVGRRLAEKGYILCNGGYGGVMEASARGAKEKGGETLGIVTSQFSPQANPWIDETQVMPTWQERLFRLIEVGDAYVVLDGGTGTLTELFVVWEMTNKQLLQKPIIVYGSFFQNMVQDLSKQKFVKTNPFLYYATDVDKIINLLS